MKNKIKKYKHRFVEDSDCFIKELTEKQIQKMTTSTSCCEDPELQDEQLLERKHYDWQMTKAEEFDDSDNSISTYSSMPGLISIISHNESDGENYYDSDDEYMMNKYEYMNKYMNMNI